MKRPPVTRLEFLHDKPEAIWPSAAWAAVIVFVLFPIVVGAITLGAWLTGGP